MPRRIVTIYTPLVGFLIVLLFPFYWMTVTTFKSNEELYDFREYNPFRVHSPTLANVNRLLFETDDPQGLTVNMTVAVAANGHLAVRERARRLRHPAAALQGRAVCRPGDLPRLPGAALDPVHPARHHGVQVRAVRQPDGADPDLPDLPDPVLHLAPDRLLQVESPTSSRNAR